MNNEIDTINMFAVGVCEGKITIYSFIPCGARLPKADALNLAAWLVTLADDKDEFPALLEAVQNT